MIKDIKLIIRFELLHEIQLIIQSIERDSSQKTQITHFKGINIDYNQKKRKK